MTDTQPCILLASVLLRDTMLLTVMEIFTLNQKLVCYWYSMFSVYSAIIAVAPPKSPTGDCPLVGRGR